MPQRSSETAEANSDGWGSLENQLATIDRKRLPEPDSVPAALRETHMAFWRWSERGPPWDPLSRRSSPSCDGNEAEQHRQITLLPLRPQASQSGSFRKPPHSTWRPGDLGTHRHVRNERRAKPPTAPGEVLKPGPGFFGKPPPQITSPPPPELCTTLIASCTRPAPFTS
ncbi:hypothetical protein VTK26DRAFT_8923 [Humicola hyalothermophila]